MQTKNADTDTAKITSEFQQIIAEAQQMAEPELAKIVREAEQKAQQIIIEARQKAELQAAKTSSKTPQKAQQIIAEAKKKAEPEVAKMPSEAHQKAEESETLRESKQKAQRIIHENTPIPPVVSRSDSKKFAGSRLSGKRNFVVLDGEELDLNKRVSSHSSGNWIFAIVNEEEEELDLDERPSSHSPIQFSIHILYAMLYLGLSIGFLITTIAVDMPSNKLRVFIAGTVIFGAVFLFLLIWWWTKYNTPPKQTKKLPNHDEGLQID